MTRTNKLPQNSDVVPLIGRHTPQQLEWLDEIFDWPAAQALAREIPVVIGRASKCELYDPEDDGPGEKFLRITHPMGAARGAVIHEFGHAYCLANWPWLAPDRGVKDVYCEAAALVPIWRLFMKGNQEEGDLYGYLRGWFTLPGMPEMACRIAGEAETANPKMPLHALMKRMLGGSPIPG